jgi:hypothetical protein
MKKFIKLVVVGVLLSSALSACVVVPAGPPHPHYYRPYYGPGPYYGR